MDWVLRPCSTCQHVSCKSAKGTEKQRNQHIRVKIQQHSLWLWWLFLPRRQWYICRLFIHILCHSSYINWLILTFEMSHTSNAATHHLRKVKLVELDSSLFSLWHFTFVAHWVGEPKLTDASLTKQLPALNPGTGSSPPDIHDKSLTRGLCQCPLWHSDSPMSQLHSVETPQRTLGIQQILRWFRFSSGMLVESRGFLL